MSKIIEQDKKQYYNQLKCAQRSLDITDWVNYFAQMIFERQFKAIQRMLENGITGFEGGMTAKKYIAITKTSKATATRDLQDLHELGVFEQNGAGRSVRYELVL
ncbi:MAG: hypothetical protein P0Y49_10775 [Candidatus Pedobacter colombiensis]|uniref:Fic family protein n=1 Tax=Candidatus Pedobacter colombiensis TaxID=3121371 RepID=A0AAJ6B964_9SPHI|nr:hypothetical protein [Pedobacter sp.]WEK21619.1 MAG: hypothetical protein P0Y49_10775 [Pedobacter sp.]